MDCSLEGQMSDSTSDRVPGARTLPNPEKTAGGCNLWQIEESNDVLLRRMLDGTDRIVRTALNCSSGSKSSSPFITFGSSLLNFPCNRLTRYMLNWHMEQKEDCKRLLVRSSMGSSMLLSTHDTSRVPFVAFWMPSPSKSELRVTPSRWYYWDSMPAYLKTQLIREYRKLYKILKAFYG